MWGLFVSTDGGDKWTRQSPVIDGINAIIAKGDTVFAGHTGGISRSVDAGKSWKTTSLNPNGRFHFVSALFAVDNRMYAGIDMLSEGGRLAISNDNGQSWSINVLLGTNYDFQAHAVYVSNKRIFVGTTKGVRISEDDGKSWKSVGKKDGFPDGRVSALSGFGNNVYVGWGDREAGQVSISEDGGQTWRLQNTTRSGLRNIVTSVYISQKNDVYVTSFRGGVAISSDAGKTWSKNLGKKDGLDSDEANDVYVLGGDNIYVANDMAMSISRDGGQTWRIENGIPYTGLYHVYAQCV